MDPWIGVLSASFKDKHFVSRVRRQPISKEAACRTRTNDNVVIFLVRCERSCIPATLTLFLPHIYQPVTTAHASVAPLGFCFRTKRHVSSLSMILSPCGTDQGLQFINFHRFKTLHSWISASFFLEWCSHFRNEKKAPAGVEIQDLMPHLFPENRLSSRGKKPWRVG